MNATPVFSFIIPATPTAKGRARSSVVRGKGGKIVTTQDGRPIISHHTPEKTRNFEALVKDFAQQAARGTPLGTAVDLFVEFRFAIPKSWPKWQCELAAAGLLHHTKKPDCSNLVKAIEDACNGVLFEDDGQVVGVLVDKVFTTRQECIAVAAYARPGVAIQQSRASAETSLLAMETLRDKGAHLPLQRRFLDMAERLAGVSP